MSNTYIYFNGKEIITSCFRMNIKTGESIVCRRCRYDPNCYANIYFEFDKIFICNDFLERLHHGSHGFANLLDTDKIIIMCYGDDNSTAKFILKGSSLEKDGKEEYFEENTTIIEKIKGDYSFTETIDAQTRERNFSVSLRVSGELLRPNLGELLGS